MTAAAPRAGRGVAEHWHIDDQFARQLTASGAGDMIRGRWRIFADALMAHRGRTAGSEPLRVLDAGCGDGINLVALRQMLPALGRPWRLYGMDTSPLRLDRARVPERADGRVLQASVAALPFASSSLDVVLCNHVIEHVPDPGAALGEIARVLTPEGLAIIGVPNEGCALARLRNSVLQRSILHKTDHVNFFTRQTLTAALEQGGLEVRDIRTEGFFLPHLRLLAPVRATAAGRALLEAARRLLPSQAASLIAVAIRPA